MTPTMTDEETFVTERDRDFSDSDFAAIEAAVMETSRGRWFLREFARRNRHADTETVLTAIARLQDDTLPGRAVRVMDHLPKTPTERVRKVELRDTGVTLDTYDRGK